MNPQDIEKEIKKITGNEAVLEELYKLLESGQAIALVGAGASAEADLWPLWDKFLEEFVKHSLKCGKISQEEADFFLRQAPQTPLETAQQLRNKIGDPLYFEYIQETFKDKNSPHTGGAFTRTHQALMQLPIHNYLTLNYDAGLTNARAVLYPKSTTSYYFWDQEEARCIRDRGYKRQVLHAHGRYDRADSIILTQNDYRRAYDNRAFVRLLEDLFAFENLLIVGFGMSDPYVKKLFDNVTRDYQKSRLRHIAFVDLKEEDLQVTHLWREKVEMVYGARILFYPAKDSHKALTDWLTMFVEKFKEVPGSKTAEEIQPLSTPPQLRTALQDKYIHQPTDDENFKGRKQDFVTLNRWGNDPATRMIAITGIGGQGKTALVGRWLKQERTPTLAQMPVFYWSFYQDLDVGKFLEQVVEFCLPIVRVVGTQQIETISFILSVVQQARLLLVLDGLEVLQEEASKPAHGRVTHPLLEQLLQQWLRYPHQGLMILTSRFRFSQLERFSGVGFHHLNLVRLSTEDGISLLRKLNVLGEDQILKTYVEKLYGHPLALRVLASTVKRCCFGDLAQFKGGQILDVTGEDRVSQKLAHLLSFYEKQLKDGQRELLGIISLFKRPVETKSFVTLLSKMKSLKDTPLAKAKAELIEKQLALLVDDFLVEKTKEGITTHPVIRDYFRNALKISGSRQEVADFLKAKPGADKPQNIKEVRDLVEAVQLLCDEGEFKAASNLRFSRLDQGGYAFNVFRDLPAVAEGLECDLAFVGDDVRMQKMEKILGKSTVAAHCSGVSLYNSLLGNLAQSMEWLYTSLEIYRQLQDKHSQAIELCKISNIEMVMGNIQQTRRTISHSLSLSHETKDLSDLRSEFAFKGYCEFLLGNSRQAYLDFEIALLYEQRRKSDEQHLYAFKGSQQAEFFIHLQVWKQFEAINAWSIKRCEEYHWNDSLALCYLLQGWYEICQWRLSQAENALVQAESILCPSGMVEYICRLDWVWALLAEAKGEYEKGLHRANDALFTCADKGFRLWQADLMVLRGRLHLLQFQKENDASNVIASPEKRGEAIPDSGAQANRLLRRPDESGTPRNDELKDLLEKAGDDGNEALKIAEQTGYIWAKVEALELLASYHQTRASLSGFNSQEEKDFAQRYAKETASIKAGLFLTEKQMEELKAQARKEFEKQVAGWEKK